MGCFRVGEGGRAAQRLDWVRLRRAKCVRMGGRLCAAVTVATGTVPVGSERCTVGWAAVGLWMPGGSRGAVRVVGGSC